MIRERRESCDILAAPRGVELDEEVLVLGNDLVELVGDENEDGLVLNGGLLRLDRGGDLAGDKVGDEGADGGGVDGLGLVEGVLGHLLEVLDGERGPGRLLEVEGLGVVGELKDRVE